MSCEFNSVRIGDIMSLVQTRNTNNQCRNAVTVSAIEGVVPQKSYYSKELTSKNASNYFLLIKGDFLYNRSYSVGYPIGAIRRLDCFDVAILSPIYIALRIKKSAPVTSDYLKYFLSSSLVDPIVSPLVHEGSRGHGMLNLKASEMLEVEIPLPPYPEQKAIARILSSLDDKIELNNRMNKTLEEIAQTLFKRWFVDFEFPDENGDPYKSSGGKMVESELGKIPEGWKVSFVSSFTKEMKNGGTPSRKIEEFWSPGEVQWLKTGEIHNSIIIKTEEFISKAGLQGSSAKLLPINTVVMAMYGATAGQLGILRTITSTNQACCAMICNSANQSLYLYLILLNNQKYIESLAVGAAQQNLSKDAISNYKIISPPSMIVEKSRFALLYDVIEMNLRQNDILSQIRDTLLPKLMSGEVRVPITEE